MNGEVVAKVTKIWDGVARGCFTNANTFGCHCKYYWSPKT